MDFKNLNEKLKKEAEDLARKMRQIEFYSPLSNKESLESYEEEPETPPITNWEHLEREFQEKNR